MEVVQRADPGHDATMFSSGLTDSPIVNQARQQLSLVQLSSHQVDELRDFAEETYSLSHAIRVSSETSSLIKQLYEEIKQLLAGLKE
jgi:hypothetical protein